MARSIFYCAVLGALWAASAACAQTTLTVGKAVSGADPIMPVNVGDEVGIFKKHGLDLKILDFTGGSKMSQAMAAGSIDIGDGAGAEMVAVAKGVPMIAICETTSTFPYMSVGVPDDSAVTSLKGLKGKKIGVTTAASGSLSDWLAKELARQEGWADSDLVEVAIGSSTVAAFRTHLVDADIGATSLFLNMDENKIGRVLAPVTDFEGPAASGALYGSNRMIDTDPAAVKAFVAAWVETIDYIRTHKAETVKIEARVGGFSESVMSREYDMVMSMFTKACEFDPQSIATLKREFTDAKLVDGRVDMSKLYTEAFLPK